MAADDATGPSVANAQQLGDKWMMRCFERNNMGNNSSHHPMEATKVPQTAPMLDISEMYVHVHSSLLQEPKLSGF